MTLAKFAWMVVALQLAVVVAGHYLEAVINVSGVLGTVIPFVIAIAYGATASAGIGPALRGGLILGVVGALAGVAAAMALGDQTWVALTFAPLTAGLAGALGALVGSLAGGGALAKGKPKGRPKRKAKG